MEGSDPSNTHESELPFDELFDRLTLTEQRLAAAEQEIIEQTSRRCQAEEDLGAQIKKATEFEDMYHTEWGLRKSVEAELERAMKRIEELEKRGENRAESSKRNEKN